MDAKPESKTNEEIEKDLLGCLAGLLFIPVKLSLSAAMCAWAIPLLWGWFVLPLFPSAPILTGLQAVGIGLVAGYFLGVPSSSDGSKPEWGKMIVTAILFSIVRPAITVAVGYIVHRLM